MTLDVASGVNTARRNGAIEPGARAIRRLLLIVAAAVLLGILPFLSGLVGSLILYVVTRRLHARLSRVVPQRVSALIIPVGVFIVLLVPGAWLVSTIVSEGADAVRSWRADDVYTWLSRTPFGEFDVTKTVASAGTAVFAWFSTHATALFGSVASTGVNVVIALFGLYYLLLGAEPLWSRAKRLLPVSDRVAELLAARFAAVTEALLLGTVLTAVLQGAVVGVGFALVGLHPAVLWGFVTACVSVLPLFGSALVWLPGVVILLFDHRPGAALGLAVLGGGIASNLDNVVRLLLYRRVSGIHPMLTLLGAFAGLRMFGVIGAFLGPLILSYLVELLDVYEEAVSHT